MQLGTQWHTAWGKNIETSSMSLISTDSTDKKSATNMWQVCCFIPKHSLVVSKTCTVTSVSPSMCTSPRKSVIPMPSNGNAAWNARNCSKVQVADMLWHRCFLISLPFVTWNLRLQKRFYHWNSAFDAFTVSVWSCLNLLQFVSTSYRCRDHGWKSCSPSCPRIPEACWVCFGWIAMAEESWSLLWFTPRGPMMTPMKGAWTGWRMMADAGCNWIQWQHKQHIAAPKHSTIHWFVHPAWGNFSWVGLQGGVLRARSSKNLKKMLGLCPSFVCASTHTIQTCNEKRT